MANQSPYPGRRTISQTRLSVAENRSSFGVQAQAKASRLSATRRKGPPQLAWRRGQSPASGRVTPMAPWQQPLLFLVSTNQFVSNATGESTIEGRGTHSLARPIGPRYDTGVWSNA